MSFYPEAVADGYDFVHNGKTYHCGLITQEVKSRFEKAVFAKEKQKLAEVKDLLSPEGYQAKADALAERYLAGGFAIVQADMKQSPLAVPENALTMMALLCGVDEVEMIALAASCKELTDIMKAVMRDSFPGVTVSEGEEKKTS